MNRRDALKAVGGLAGVAALGSRFASAHPGPYRPLGTLDIDGAKEVVLDEDGTTAFVAATDGFVVVDVTTPSRLEALAERRDLLADRENGPLREIYDVKHADDRLIVPGPANPKRGDVLQGFLLYDVSDPANPKRLAFHETDFPIHNCFLREGIAYLTGNDNAENPLVMVDVSGDSPEEVGRWSIVDHDAAWSEVDPAVRTLHDVWVQDGTAYLSHWDAGLWIVDVSDPANPEYDTHFGGVPLDELTSGNGRGSAQVVELPGNVHYAMPNEDASLLALNREAWDDPATNHDGGPGGVDLWSLPTLGDPEKLATIEPPASPDPTIGGVWTTSHNFDIRGDRLYTSWYQGGVKVHDVSDPANPEEIAWWREPRETAFWTARLAKATTKPGLSAEGYFMATDMGTDGGSGGTGHAASAGLYAFGDEEGTQKSPPPLSAAGDGNTASTEVSTGGSGGGGSAADGTANGGNTTTTGGQRGFGALVALGGMALAAWRLRGGD